MNENTAEWLKIGLVFLLIFCIADLSDKNVALQDQNAKLKKELVEATEYPPDGFNGHNGVMFHLLASENYRLGGEAKNWLKPNEVIPHDEINDLLKNGWHFPNGAKNGAVPNKPRNLPDKAGR